MNDLKILTCVLPNDIAFIFLEYWKTEFGSSVARWFCNMRVQLQGGSAALGFICTVV